MGSVTKSWTAIAVMQHYENGTLDIDAPIARYVDPVLKKWNGTTLYELWNVTVRECEAAIPHICLSF